MNVVYTAISNQKDVLTQGNNTEGATFIAYLDHSTNPDLIAKDGDWFIKKLKKKNKRIGQGEDFVRQAKDPKVNPHRYLFEAHKIEYSLWMDGNVKLKVPMQTLIDKYLKNHDIAFFAHPQRDCIYQEADVCRRLVLGNPFVMEFQMKSYKNAGYPEHNGLIDGSVILRRHSPKVQKINEAWWSEILKGSRRDQLSFNYVMWKLKEEYAIMEGFNHVHPNNYFEMARHIREKN